MRRLKRFVRRTLMVLGVIFLVLVGGGIALWSALVTRPEPVPEVAVLELDLADGLSPIDRDDGLAALVERAPPNLRQVVEALDEAGRDDRIKGLVARLGNAEMGTATIQELRDAVAAFRATGKFAVAFAESFGEMGLGGAGAYYLATAFDEIWLQPSGDLGLTGLLVETTFLRRALDKIGILPRVGKRKAYKTAADPLTDTAYSPAFRESMETIAESMFDQIVTGIGGGREMPAERVRALIDDGPFLAAEAAEAGLVDGLAYRDEVEKRVRERAGEDSEIFPVDDYLRRDDREEPDGPTVAYIVAAGPILPGEGGGGGPFSIARAGADTLIEAFEEAMDDEEVVAILFRIDSPGGSYVASDAIWRAVLRAREAGKPVIVSMGDVAASGGYFIAAPATRIVAAPGTLTGSIGVVAGKVVISELLEKLGITTDSVKIGANADMWSLRRDFSPEAWARFPRALDRIYEDFTAKVAEGRRLPPGRIDRVAEGRIWSGRDAKAVGLVDDLGGYRKALAAVREEAGLEPDEPLRLKRFPEPETGLERALRDLAGGAEAGGRAAALVAYLLDVARPAIAALGLLDPAAGPLRMPPVRVR